MAIPERKTTRLRFGRVSIPGAKYFVTCCTRDRSPVFLNSAAAASTFAAFQTLHAAHDADVLAAVVMQDHVHVLFTLGSRLRLGQVLAKFKTAARLGGRVAWSWQDESFEHRLREGNSTEDYAFYIYMNPYRAGLLSIADRWPWWFCPAPELFLFLSGIEANEPIPLEWIEKSKEAATRLMVHS